MRGHDSSCPTASELTRAMHEPLYLCVAQRFPSHVQHRPHHVISSSQERTIVDKKFQELYLAWPRSGMGRGAALGVPDVKNQKGPICPNKSQWMQVLHNPMREYRLSCVSGEGWGGGGGGEVRRIILNWKVTSCAKNVCMLIIDRRDDDGVTGWHSCNPRLEQYEFVIDEKLIQVFISSFRITRDDKPTRNWYKKKMTKWDLEQKCKNCRSKTDQLRYILCFSKSRWFVAWTLKRTFSQPFNKKCVNKVVTISRIIVGSSELALKRKVLDTVWYYNSGEAAREIEHAYKLHLPVWIGSPVQQDFGAGRVSILRGKIQRCPESRILHVYILDPFRVVQFTQGIGPPFLGTAKPNAVVFPTYNANHDGCRTKLSKHSQGKLRHSCWLTSCARHHVPGMQFAAFGVCPQAMYINK